MIARLNRNLDERMRGRENMTDAVRTLRKLCASRARTLRRRVMSHDEMDTSMWNIPENERVEVTSENFGELLLESAREALAIARGELLPARIEYASTTTRTA